MHMRIEGNCNPKSFFIFRPVLRVPTLAIHLDGSANEAFKFNKETHMLPVLATTVKT